MKQGKENENMIVFATNKCKLGSDFIQKEL